MKPSISTSISRRQAMSFGLGLVAAAEIESLPFVHAQPKRATFLSWFTAHGMAGGVGGVSSIDSQPKATMSLHPLSPA